MKIKSVLAFLGRFLLTSYKTTHFYAVRRIRALKMSTKMLQKAEICLEYGCKNLKHNITIKKMKKNKTTLLIGLGLVLTASLLLLCNKDGSNSSKEDEEKDTNGKEKEKKNKNIKNDIKENQQVIENTLIYLVKERKFTTLTDLYTTLLSEVVQKSKDINILYEAPKNIEELEELIVSLGLYETFSSVIGEGDTA